jgi:co-chaperonin GroES (HSP10)
MQLIKNTFLLTVDAELHRTTKIKGINGEYLTLDTDTDKHKYATQIGIISHVPLSVGTEFNYDTPLRENDIVFFHFHVSQPKHAINIGSVQYFKCPYFEIWCKVENEKIIPLEDYIFVEPILESEDDLFCNVFKRKVYQEEIKSTGIIFAIGNQAKYYGLEVGDKVFLTKNADVEIEILGKKLWRARIRNIIGVEREGKLVCIKNKILVKEVQEEEIESFLITFDEYKKERKGIVISTGISEGVSPGDKISFHNGVARTHLEYKGEQYAYLTPDNINYIIN